MALVGSLFQIPVLGGPPRKVLEDINTPPAFSPDGTRMAFTRSAAEGGQVIIASADGTNQRRLASRPASDGYTGRRVAWSPDGTLIAAFAGEIPRQRSRIVLVDVETGKEQEFSDARFDYGGSSCGSATPARWCSMPSSRPAGVGTRTAISGPSRTRPARCAGSPRTSTSYRSVTATAGGRTLVAVRDEMRVGLWVAPDGDSARARPITGTSGLAGAGGIDWTRDGRIVYGAHLAEWLTSGSPMPTAARRGN